MNTPTRLVAFAAGLVVVFGAAAGVGNAVGPVGTASPTEVDGEHTASPATASAAGSFIKGLSASQDGYTLVLSSTTHPTGASAPFTFQIAGPDGTPVTGYSPTHDKPLHLVVVRRDTAGFQHLHPELDGAGRWTTPLTLPGAGSYKVFADFAPAGSDAALTLAADVQAAGPYEPAPLPPVSQTAEVDGYTVTLAGDLVAGQTSGVTLSVAEDGQPVQDLQPYLAAYGHLVALRTSDLAYLHVHADGAGDGRTAAGPEVPFAVEVPTAGSYRLFLDFQHDGVVRTAAFTATASASDAPTQDAGPRVPGVPAPAASPHSETTHGR